MKLRTHVRNPRIYNMGILRHVCVMCCWKNFYQWLLLTFCWRYVYPNKGMLWEVSTWLKFSKKCYKCVRLHFTLSEKRCRSRQGLYYYCLFANLWEDCSAKRANFVFINLENVKGVVVFIICEVAVFWTNWAGFKTFILDFVACKIFWPNSIKKTSFIRNPGLVDRVCSYPAWY